MLQSFKYDSVTLHEFEGVSDVRRIDTERRKETQRDGKRLKIETELIVFFFLLV